MLEYLTAFLLTVGASARMTRLIVQDAYPPVAWMRQWWYAHIPARWAMLVTCAHCAAPWVTLVVGGVGYGLGFPTAWWLATAWLTASWLAGMLLERMGAP
jgi:hypothetical protein